MIAGENTHTIEATNLNNGLYFVNITVDGQTIAEKIQVAK